MKAQGFFVFLVFFAVLHLTQVQAQVEIQKPRSKNVRGVASQTIIAPSTVPIPDEHTLIRMLTPHSTPPDSIFVFLSNESGVMVNNLEWIDPQGNNPEPETQISLCACTCILRRPPFICARLKGATYEQCCDRCCKMRLEGPNPEPYTYDRLSHTQLAEVDAILAEAGLRRTTGKGKTYPIALHLYGSYPNPQLTITCMEKKTQGNCNRRWRICGSTMNGSRCYDIVNNPDSGWTLISLSR